mmetsp:Transcript_34079/g.106694  ORF Transcript_34079/g.106694 Transcript_34079/m.106694 type:complete len:235 (-) Transcript_34079:512-1216(-)
MISGYGSNHVPQRCALSRILDACRHPYRFLDLICKFCRNHGVWTTSAGKRLRRNLLDLSRNFSTPRKVGGGGREHGEQLLLIGQCQRSKGDQLQGNTVLPHQLQEQLSPPERMLLGVTARQDDHGDPELNVANNLAEQVEEVGEVAHARHKDRVPSDGNHALGVVLKEQVSKPPLHLVGLRRFLDLSDSVLLSKVDRLIPNKNGCRVQVQQVCFQLSDGLHQLLALGYILVPQS